MLNTSRFTKNIIVLRWCMYFLIGFLIDIVVISLIKGLFESDYFIIVKNLESNGFSFIEILSIQVSVSFIVISIVTVFTQKNIIIYWEDIMYYKLIRPLFSNFSALSSYLIVDLIISIILMCTNNKYAYITFFLSIVFIIFLSLRMIEAFFMKELIQKNLEKKYKYYKDHRREKRRYRDLYREYKGKTIQYTLQAVDNGDVDTVCENAAFLYRFSELDDMQFIINQILYSNQFYMLSRMVKECRFIFKELQIIDNYIRICSELLKKDKASEKFVKSIVRSIGEYVMYDSMPEQRTELTQYYSDVIGQFMQLCISLEYNELAKEIDINYKKQVNDVYAK